MSAIERGTVIEPPQNIWSMYSGRGFSNMSHPTINEISNDEHLEGRRVVHWNPRVIGLTGGCLVLTMVLALSLGLSLGGRNKSSELNLADWQDACQNDHLSGKGWNRCIKQCQLYVCCDGRPGDCNLNRDPFCNRYDGWCAVLRVSAEYRESGQLTDEDDDDNVPPSMTPPTGNYGSYPTNTEGPIVPVSGEPTSVPPTATTLAPTLMPTTSSPPTGNTTLAPTLTPTTSSPPTGNTTLAPTLTPTASSPPTGNTTLAPTLIPAISSPPSLRPSRAPVVAPKITPSPTETPTTRAPARTFKM